jgi:hypothetical protein
MLLRTLATLAFAASFDILLLDGKYIHAVEQLALSVFWNF